MAADQLATALGIVGGIFGLASAVALLTSLVLTGLSALLGRARLPSTIVDPWLIALGFLAGYSLLPRDFAGFVPEPSRPWTWLPYLALITAVSSGLLAAIAKRWANPLALLVTAVFAAFLLTPTWPVWGLGPSATRWLVLAYLLAVGLAYQCQPQQMRPFACILLFAATAALLALATGALVSARLAQLAAITSGAMAGLAIARRFTSNRDAPIHSLIPLCCVLLAGMAWIACVDPDPPKESLLLIPFLPVCVGIVLAVIARIRRQQADHRSAAGNGHISSPP